MSDGPTFANRRRPSADQRWVGTCSIDKVAELGWPCIRPLRSVRRLAGSLAAAATVTCLFVGTPGAAAASSTTGPDGYPIPPGGDQCRTQACGEFVHDRRGKPRRRPRHQLLRQPQRLRDYVYYSKPSNDISWHWTWSCDGEATLTGSQALFYNNYPATSGPYSSGPGFSGGVNARYALCMVGWWQGIMSGTSTAPGYTPASVEGSSPSNHVTC